MNPSPQPASPLRLSQGAGIGSVVVVMTTVVVVGAAVVVVGSGVVAEMKNSPSVAVISVFHESHLQGNRESRSNSPTVWSKENANERIQKT